MSAQVAGVFVLADGLHRTQRMVEAGDSLLQLCVQHGAVSHHDDTGKHRLVLGVEQGSQPVRRPCNGIGLARPGAVLDEIVLPGTLLPHVCHQLAHHVQLVIPGKDEGLTVLQAHELLQDVHHAVLLEHFFPEVYDSDEAGQKATLRSLELFRNSPVKVGVLQIPGAKDPDEYIKKYGPERFQALLDGVGNALDFRLKRLRDQYDLSQDAQRLQYVKEAVEMLAERSNPTEQEVYAGRLAEETNISKTAILAQLGTAAKRAGGKYRREKNRELLRSGEMDQIKVPYSAGGSQALGIASAQQRLLAAILREPRYLELAKQQLTAEQFIQPQQKELYEAMLNCSREGVELSLTALRAFVSEEALNELSRLAAQYSDVNCTPDDIRLYLDRIARGMPVASKAAAMSGDEITQYLQSMREKKQGTLPEQD